MISYKNQRIAEEWALLHPACRAIVRELAHYLDSHEMPGVLVTDVARDEAEMASIYGDDWKARGKFSWHLKNRAVDIRNREWSRHERARITAWLKANWPGAEVLMHDVGRGDHLHIAVPGPWSTIKRLRRWVSRRRN